MKKFVKGRKSVFTSLKNEWSPEEKVIWLHAASLGEYEQGVPILEKLKEGFPKYKILVSFFSPSGYEVKKNTPLADFTTYLPIDTKRNARKFIELAGPDLAIFVKYEIWPNYLRQLKERQIPALLISGNFRPHQPYFNSSLPFMKDALASFTHLFVQTSQSQRVLTTNGFKNITVSGDTRFDRVSQQPKMDNHLPFIDAFKDKQCCIVCGSTWPADEALLLESINASPKNVKYIIAPHQIKTQNIADFRKNLNRSSVLYSEREEKKLKDYAILIIDAVGFLTKVYAYADMAYVGGAAGKTGLHNILEPAAFGLPILIGKNHEKFPEAKMLENKGGLYVVNDKEECFNAIKRLVKDENFRKETGQRASEFINQHRGATQTVMRYIKKHLLKNK